MLESQEIDALLISALYGELTPAEETRLEAHLGSHPADRMALAALTSTREVLRSSRILQVQLDPPQSVSALLMQEAARRAPKAEEREGWFARLARSFMAHPAMAAAAMLVVVVGVVTLVQTRKGDQFTETAPAQSQSVGAKASTTDQTIEPAKDHAGDRLDEGVRGGEAGSNVASGSAAFGGDTNAGYRVSLAESDGRQRKLEAETAEVKKGQVAKQDPTATPRDVSGVADTKAKNAKAGIANKPPSGAYMELRSAEPTVKDFESNANGEAQGRTYATPTDDLAKENVNANVNAVTPGPGLGASGGNTTTATAPTTAPRGKAAPGMTKPTSPKAPDSQVSRDVDASPRNQPAPVRNSPPPPPPAPPAKVVVTTGSASGGSAKAVAPAEDRSANDPQLAWAREQHTAIIAHVRSRDCKGAASIAVVLSNRDLGYYMQNVASDRSVKECLAYIDNAREKDQEQRAERSKPAQKRTTNEPAKKAADQPAATTDAAH